MTELSSKYLTQAVEAFASLPGIGKKTALRLVLHLLQEDKERTHVFTEAIKTMRNEIKICENCFNIADQSLCSICLDKKRDEQIICVVESIRDIMAIEETGQFRGKYHVLGGVIKPIEGIRPDDLTIDTLIDRIKQQKVKEIIMAISPTIEGDTTIFYISKKIKNLPVTVSTIARGISFGGELQYADGITLGRSIVARTRYEVE